MTGLFSILIMLALLLVPFAQAAPDWEKAFKDVCSFDHYCERLKMSDGAWVKPRNELLAVIKSPAMNAEIHRVAKLYNIDPVMIAGAIIAENTMNVSMKDTAQTWLAANMGITGVGNKKFSYGFGQINDEAAIEAEAHVAKIEGRPAKSMDEIRAEILDPAKCIRLVGAIVRQVQDDYKAQGFDISKDVGVSTTLYNLGKSKEKAAQAKKNGATPKSNYFGFFVSKYMSEVKAAVGSPAVKPLSTLATAKPDKVQVPAILQSSASGVAQIPEKGKTPEAAGAVPKLPGPNVPTEQVDVLTKTLPLVSAPPLCMTTDNDRGRFGSEQGANTAAYGAPVGVIEKNQSFRMLSRALDCDTTTWRLIETETGQTGWIKEAILESNQAKDVRPLNPLSCKADSKGGKACATALRAKLGAKSIGTENNLIYVSPVGPNMPTDGEKAVSFDNEDFQCRDRTKEFEDRNQYYNQPQIPRPVPPQLSLSDAVKESRERAAALKLQLAAHTSANQDGSQDSTPPLATPDELMTGADVYKGNIRFYDKEIKRIASKIGLDVADLDTMANPYQQLTQSLAQFRRLNSDCLAIASSETPRDCELYPVAKEVREALKQIDFDSAPDINEVVTAQRAIHDAGYRGSDRIRMAITKAQGYPGNIDAEIPYANYVPGEAELASRTPDEIRKAMASCHAQVSEIKAQMRRDSEEAMKLYRDCQNDKSKCDDWNNSKWGKRRQWGGLGVNNGFSVTYTRSSQPIYQSRNGGNVGGFGIYDEDAEPFFKAAQSATDDQIKAHSSDFVSFARFCHARLNLYSEKTPQGDSLDCAVTPEFVNIANGRYARAVVAKTYQNDPGSLVSELTIGIPIFIKPSVVKEILGDEFVPKPTPTAQPQQISQPRFRDEPKGPPNYCPNKTVEYIEELLKENQCIKHVYVPTRFLSGKLSPTDQRVIYRKFDKNDRFAIEVGSQRCAVQVKK